MKVKIKIHLNIIFHVLRNYFPVQILSSVNFIVKKTLE